MISTPVLVPKSKNTHVFKETSFLISFIGFIAILFMGLIIILLKPSNYLFSLIPLIIIFFNRNINLCNKYDWKY